MLVIARVGDVLGGHPNRVAIHGGGPVVTPAGARRGLIAVSRAPHSEPLAYITCCMRVSFESGRETTSLCAGSPPNNRRQQPTPAIVAVVVSLMQWPSGTPVPGRLPEPG